MTIITAISNGDTVVLGYSDGTVVDGIPVSGKFCPWIFFGPWAFGITGQSSVASFISANKQNYSTFQDIEELVKQIFDDLKDADFGAKSPDDYVSTFGIYSIIVNSNGSVWNISDCLSITNIDRGVFWAQGSGCEFALGASVAMDALQSGLSGEKKTLVCLNAAIRCDIDCVGTPRTKSITINETVDCDLDQNSALESR